MRIAANGVTVNYDLSGSHDNEAVVLSHSLGSSLKMWDPQVDAFAAKYCTLRYDTRGHGSTQVVAGDYTLNQLGDDAVGLMDALGIGVVHWVGLSLGGMIGQNLALRYPDRLRTLVLCDTTSVIPDDAQAMWVERMETARRAGMEALADATMQRWFTASYAVSDPAPIQTIRKEFVKTSVVGFVGCCQAIRRLNYLESLSEITLPTLIVVGADDISTPVAASRAMHERIRGSGLSLIPSASHLSNVEQSDEFNRVVLDFLTSHRVDSAGRNSDRSKS